MYVKALVVFVQLTFTGVLDAGDDFQNSNEVYEAIGEVLHEVASDKGEDEIRYHVCNFI